MISMLPLLWINELTALRCDAANGEDGADRISGGGDDRVG